MLVMVGEPRGFEEQVAAPGFGESPEVLIREPLGRARLCLEQMGNCQAREGVTVDHPEQHWDWALQG